MSQAIDYFNSKHPFRRFASQMALRARNHQWQVFLKHFQDLLNPKMRVLDLGTTPDSDLPDSNLFAKRLAGKVDLTLSSPEDCSGLAKELGAQFIPQDQISQEIKKQKFDLVVSIAVLEHVGSLQNQKHFASLVKDSAQYFFLTTPHRFFPIELHTFLPFIHWLPKSIHRWILRSVFREKFWSQEANLNLFGNEIVDLFSNPERPAGHYFTRILGWPSNHIMIRSPITRSKNSSEIASQSKRG